MYQNLLKKNKIYNLSYVNPRTLGLTPMYCYLQLFDFYETKFLGNTNELQF